MKNPLLLCDPCRLQQQVPGGIPPEGELGGEHQVGCLGFRLANGCKDAIGIALQVAHQGVQLSQSDVHQQRLPDSP